MDDTSGSALVKDGVVTGGNCYWTDFDKLQEGMNTFTEWDYSFIN